MTPVQLRAAERSWPTPASVGAAGAVTSFGTALTTPDPPALPAPSTAETE